MIPVYHASQYSKTAFSLFKSGELEQQNLNLTWQNQCYNSQSVKKWKLKKIL